MNTTYAIGNEVYASKDLIFGWCFWSHGNSPLPIRSHSVEQIEALLKLYTSGLYPEELRDALREGLAFVKQGEENMVALTELCAGNKVADKPVTVADSHNTGIPVSDIRRIGEGDYFTSTYEALRNPHDTSVAKEVHQQALSKLAIYYFMTLGLSTKGNRLIAYLMDNAFDLTLRTEGPNGNFLSLQDCPVTARKPTDAALYACGLGFIPYTD